MNLDKIAFALANELLGCLCDQLALSTGGAPCRCCVSVGPAPMDFCCECASGTSGQGWVRVVSIFPTSTRFPNRVFDVERCARSIYGIEFEVGAYRCVSKLDDEGRPPSCEDLTRDVEVILDDAAAMRAAVECCFRTRDRVMSVGEWMPIGPEGGCAGGALRVTVQAYDCCP